MNLQSFDWNKTRNIAFDGLAPVEIQPLPDCTGHEDLPVILRLMRDHREHVSSCLNFFDHDECPAMTDGCGFRWAAEENEVHILVGTYFSYKSRNPLHIDYVAIAELLNEWSEIDPEAVTVTTCSASA